MSTLKYTPGPWYWHWNGQGQWEGQGYPSLRTPDRGQLIVMDFGRRGMQGATPRFAKWVGMEEGAARNRLGGILVDFHVFQGAYGLHPDARLIAAAPQLLRFLKEARTTLEMWKDVAPAVSLCADIDAVIAEATGAAS